MPRSAEMSGDANDFSSRLAAPNPQYAEGKRVFREVRQERVQRLRRHWRPRALVSAWFVAVTTLSIWLLPTPMLDGLAIGAVIVGLIWCGSTVADVGGADRRRMGGEAERWTSQAFRKHPGWEVYDSVVLGGSEIDHIAIGPNVVLALETKYVTSKVTLMATG